MMDQQTLCAILDSLVEPVVFVDSRHMIRYMNGAAITHYKRGASLLGTSVLDCHNEKSRATILETLAAMQAGEQERLISESESRRVYMRAVRDDKGTLIGYLERYEWPMKSGT